jgi:hypothetical protein
MIRRILKSDLDDLLHWFNNPVALFLSSPKTSYPYSAESISHALLSKKDTYILSINDEVIGCISVNSENELSHLFIKPNYRDQKYSKELVKHILSLKNNVSVLINRNQREHIKLFERMNFSDSAEVFEFSFEHTKEEFKKYTLK